MSSSVSSLSISSSHPTIPYFNFVKCCCHHHHHNHPPPGNHRTTTTTISCSIRRHHRRRRNPPGKPTHTKHSAPPSDPKLRMIIDTEHLSDKAPLCIRKVVNLSELKFNQFVQSGSEAFKDLQTLITIDGDQRVVISCRRSTVRFVGNLVLWGFLIVFAFRVLVKLWSGFWNRFGFGYGGGLILRRDRSLGGRLVPVGKRKKMMNEFRISVNPLSPAGGTVMGVSEAMRKNWVRRTEKKLPNWWPVLLPPPVVTDNKQEYQRRANRLIRAIMDNRMSGKDILGDDTIQLRRICRTSGVRVLIDTINVRDSFYRASVDFVLNICGSAAGQSAFVQIDGEDARQFIAGLADNIGLENILAARMVSAAVAARTRSCFLQAWALEMQGKHSEAVVELSKTCLIHRIFPPEKNSPEMEMVARGLEKHLKAEQRESLLNMFIGVCGEESRRIVAEALGLILSREGVGDQQENMYTNGSNLAEQSLLEIPTLQLAPEPRL